MAQQMEHPTGPLKPGRFALGIAYLLFAALVVRSLTSDEIQPVLPRYLVFQLAFLILFSILSWKPRPPAWIMYAYLVLQSGIIIVLVSFQPSFDFVTILFLLLSIQTSFYFSGWTRWAWVGVLILLTVGSLAVYTGLIQALADTFTNVAAVIVIAALIILGYEIELSQERSQALIYELQETHQQLELYASQVEELAALQERVRLARELHDSVSQSIFSINLNARSAQLLLKKDPARVPEQLRLLQELTAGALSQLRSLITQLRPPQAN
jgi:signal transduction histidine kinase